MLASEDDSAEWLGQLLTKGEHDVEGYALGVALQLEHQLAAVLISSCSPDIHI